MPYSVHVDSMVSWQVFPACCACSCAHSCSTLLAACSHPDALPSDFRRTPLTPKPKRGVSLQVKCSMFSRKWASSTRGLVYQALTNASQPAGVLAPRHAEQRTQDEAQAAARRQQKRALLPRWLQRRRDPPSA